MKRFPAEKIWLDHFLAILPGVMGVYAVAMSLGKSQLAMTMALAVGLAGIMGFGLSLIFEGTRTHGIDAWLFAILGIFGFLSSRQINNLLPEEGFPFAILAAVMMFSLLIAGGLFAWRDATLLFTSLPSLVLFGLVGTIDSWRPGLFLFCGFLLSIALLYARVHQRTMIRWAEASGSDAKLLRRDVWRWMAGPEYAFAAAGTIILLSFIGAPVVQSSLSGVSSNFRINVQRQVRNSIPRPNQNNGPAPDAPVGRGPSNLSDKMLFTATMSDARYLKTQVFSRYRNRGWSYDPALLRLNKIEFKSQGETLKGKRSIEVPEAERPIKPVRVNVTIHPSDSLSSVAPIPGPVLEVDDVDNDYRETATGFLILQNRLITRSFSYVAEVPDTRRIVVDNPRAKNLEQYMNTTIVPLRIGEEAKLLTKDIVGDYAKLVALKEAIASKCQYNTQVGATPANTDPAEHFYFTSNQGYCDHFATTFTLMARAIGVPSRYVTGHLIDPNKRDSKGDYEVRENQNHAWSEVYLEGYGWVTFDATEGAVDVTPKKGDQNQLLLAIQDFFNKNASSIFAAIGIAALAGVFVLWHRRPTTEELLNTRRGAVIVANRFQKSLERVAGHPKRFSQTHREFIDMHAAKLGEAYDQSQPILNRIEQSWFGPKEFDSEELKQLSKEIATFEILSKRLAKENKRRA